MAQKNGQEWSLSVPVWFVSDDKRGQLRLYALSMSRGIRRIRRGHEPPRRHHNGGTTSIGSLVFCGRPIRRMRVGRTGHHRIESPDVDVYCGLRSQNPNSPPKGVSPDQSISAGFTKHQPLFFNYLEPLQKPERQLSLSGFFQ